MTFEAFFNGLKESPICLDFGEELNTSRASLDNEALFQLPFICMVLLVISKGKRKPLVSELGQLVGECLERSIPSFKGSSQHLGWSANLRVRTVKALSFLEQANLITVNNRNSRVQASELGKRVAQRALEGQDDLSSQLLEVARQYRNICASRQIEMELAK